jgi:hypothetical protein
VDYAALVGKASQAFGGEAELCRYLGVSQGSLALWVETASLPTAVYVKLVDVLATRSAGLLQTSRRLAQQSAKTRTAAQAAQHTALQARVAGLLRRRTALPVDRFDGQATFRFLAVERAPTGLGALLAAALDAALDAAHTRLGNVQLLDRRGLLRIRLQRGFAVPFLEFFDEVRPGWESACGAALLTGRQFVVRDVRAHPMFHGKAADVMAAAQVAAVVSSPIIDPSGNLCGMISTHHTVAGARDAAEMTLLAAIARRAGALLQLRGTAVSELRRHAPDAAASRHGNISPGRPVCS